MAKINEQRGKYFGYHPTKDAFFYTNDDAAFFEEAHANAHAGNLKVKTVEKITRTEFNTWNAENVPAQLETANTELEAANKAVIDAQAGVDALPSKSTAKVKAPFMKALNEAKNRAANAAVNVEVAKAAVEGLK
jgi:hypothetical protein